MNSLVDRGRDLETQYHHNQLHEFKTLRARNRLFALWTAKVLGMAENQHQSLVEVMIDPIYCTIKGGLLVQKALFIFIEQGHDISESHLHKQLDYFYRDAVRDITCSKL